MRSAIILGIIGSLAALAVVPPAHGRRGGAGGDVAAVVKGNTEFALSLYGKLRAQAGNLFCSPYSVSTALAMTYAGARGQTAAEMAKALDFTLDPGHLHPAFGALQHQLIQGSGKKQGYQLNVANALWGQEHFGFLPDFLNLTRRDYGAGLREVNFQSDPEAARRVINTWVEQQTHDRIKDLLPQGLLTTDTRLVLTNAIYFKGFWAEQFKKASTKQEPFQLAGGGQVQVPLMHQTGHFQYHDGGTFQALELPYRGRELSLLVLLPKRVDGLAALEGRLTAANLAAWLGRLREQEVQVALPRFKVTGAFNLNQVLEALGMRQAFIPGGADFSGMSGTNGRKLFLQAVVHKAFVDVNEEGTEAAAATGVAVAEEAEPADPAVFRADHPFVFLIRDNRSGSVLFLGRLTNPA
jgi:serpin B